MKIGLSHTPPTLSFLALLSIAGCGGSGGGEPAPLTPGLYRAEVAGTRPVGAEGNDPVVPFANRLAVAQIGADGSLRLSGNPLEEGLASIDLTGGGGVATARIEGRDTTGALSIRGATLTYEAPGALIFETFDPPTTLRARLTPLSPAGLGATYTRREGRYSGDFLSFDAAGTLTIAGGIAGELVGDRLLARSFGISVASVGARLLPGGGTDEREYAAGTGILPGPPPEMAWSGAGDTLTLEVRRANGRALLLMRRLR